MARSRKQPDLEELRGQNRLLRKKIKALEKQLGRAKKATKRAIDLSTESYDDGEDVALPENYTPCIKCGRPVVEVDLGKRKLDLCKNPACAYRSVKKA